MESLSYELEVIQSPIGKDAYSNETHLVHRRQHEQTEKLPSNASQDEVVIARFGKRQVLKRRFKSLSSIGLICNIMLTWISMLFSLQFGLANGGTAGLIYGYLAAWMGGMIQALVMAEISSMIPLAGGPFNWVAILAPAWCKKYLSYTAGWMTIIAYQAFASAVCYTNASLIQGVVILNFPSYVPQLWHATLIFYAVMAWAIFSNTILGRILPRMESIVLILYIICFFVILIPLAYLPDHRSAAEVFGEFQNLGGWETTTLSVFVGWFTSLSSFCGSDSSDHIAEEIYDAQKVIPFSIWTSFVLNGAMGFCSVLTVLFCIQDVEAATESVTGFPFMDIFVSALGSRKAASAMIVALIIINVFSSSSCVATASRTLWAFSRENGLPGSQFLVKVDPKTRLPFNAIMATMVINCTLALVSIGSVTAYDAFYSVVLAAYYSSFLIAAGVMLRKRLNTPESELPWGPFRLHKFGVPLTIIGILYTIVAFFFSFWPGDKAVTPQTMNYSIVIFGAAVIFSTIFWLVRARHYYKGPIWEFDLSG